MRELDILAKKHDKWIMLVKSLGCNSSYAEDVVQDAYIRIYDYVSKGVNIDYGDKDVNDFYMYMTLRGIYFNSIKKKSLPMFETDNINKLEIVLSRIKEEYTDIEMEAAYSRLINKIFTEINSWDFYHRNMFIAYFTSGLSFDKLSKEINIGRSSLYNSIKKYREVIKDMFNEDAQDYFAGDYNKIK